jgi:hypothetical protein
MADKTLIGSQNVNNGTLQYGATDSAGKRYEMYTPGNQGSSFAVQPTPNQSMSATKSNPLATNPLTTNPFQAIQTKTPTTPSAPTPAVPAGVVNQGFSSANPVYNTAEGKEAAPTTTGPTAPTGQTEQTGTPAEQLAAWKKQKAIDDEKTIGDWDKAITTAISSGSGSIDDLVKSTGLTADNINTALSKNPQLAGIMRENSIYNEMDSAYKEYKQKMTDIQNGSFELTDSEKAQLADTQKMLDQMRADQLLANKNYEGAVSVGEYRSGRAEFMSQMSNGIYKDAVDQGVRKIAEMDAKAISTIQQLKDAFKDKRYKLAQDLYTQLNDSLKQKNESVKSINAATKALYDSVQAKSKQDMENKTTALNQEKLQQEIQKSYATSQADYILNAMTGDAAHDAALINEIATEYKLDPTMLASVVQARQVELEKQNKPAGTVGEYMDAKNQGLIPKTMTYEEFKNIGKEEKSPTLQSSETTDKFGNVVKSSVYWDPAKKAFVTVSGGAPGSGVTPNAVTNAGKLEAPSTPIKANQKIQTTMGSAVATGPDGSDLWKPGFDMVIDGGKGAAVKAPQAFTVIDALNPGESGGFGNQVRIKLEDGQIMWVSHLDGFNPDLKFGVVYPAGTSVGAQGNTGKTLGKTGVHVDVTMPKLDAQGNPIKGEFYTSQEVGNYISQPTEAKSDTNTPKPEYGGLSQAAVDKAALQYAITGQLPSVGMGSSGAASRKREAIQNRAAELDANGSITANKARAQSLSKSLDQNTTYLNQVERNINTVHDNLKIVANLANKVNNWDSPILNEVSNLVKSRIIGSGDLAAYKAAIQTVRSEYSMILARGGQVSDTVRREAQELIPDNITKRQLQQVIDTLNAEGSNVLASAKKQVDDINNQLNNIVSGSGNTGSSGSMSDAVRAKGYNYDAMKADGMSDEEIKNALGL